MTFTGTPEPDPQLVADIDSIFPPSFDWEDAFVLDVFADCEDIEATTRALLSFAPHLGMDLT
ncbi:hypothetical protein [Streptomyces lydicus]|uniref:hypothetical protein n=1 Tax=Streptomyces lydicus TaxID=47763 RepID=UPI0037A55E98